MLSTSVTDDVEAVALAASKPVDPGVAAMEVIEGLVETADVDG